MTFQFTPPASVCVDPQSAAANCHRGCASEDIYFALTGWHPGDAAADDDREFDIHVLASLIAIAAAQGSAVHAQLGLSVDDFQALLDRCFPGAHDVFCGCDNDQAGEEDDEVAMVRELLLAHRSTEGEEGRWLASMIARRAVEPNHLWEDLGLRNRGELSRLLMRHFAPLAAQNTRNMRWKRFFYRMLCEADGMVLCTTPVCTDCTDFGLCFGEETGESRLRAAPPPGLLNHDPIGGIATLLDVSVLRHVPFHPRFPSGRATRNDDVRGDQSASKRAASRAESIAFWNAEQRAALWNSSKRPGHSVRLRSAGMRVASIALNANERSP